MLKKLFIATSILIFLVSPIAHAQSQLQMKETYDCASYSKSERIDTMERLQHESDKDSQDELAYILANCPPSQDEIQQHDQQRA